MLNHSAMEKWLQKNEDAKVERRNARQAFRRQNRQRRRNRYPEELEDLPPFMSPRWLDNALTKAQEEGESITNIEWEFSRGCNEKVYN